MATGGEETTALVVGQNRILQRLVEGVPLRESLDDINTFVERLLPGTICSIMLVDEQPGYLRLAAGKHVPSPIRELAMHFPIGEASGVCGTAAFRRESVVVEDMTRDPLTASISEIAIQSGLRSCWSVPVFGASGTAAEPPLRGTFAVYSRECRVPGTDEQEVIAVGTHLLGLAIERHIDQVALTESEARHRTLVEHARVVIWESLPVSFDYSYVSPFAGELLGIPHSDWLQPGFWERHVHPDDLDRVRQIALQEGQAGRSYRIEYRLVGVDNRVVWVDDTVTVVTQGDRVVALRGVMVDITDRKQSEVTVLQTEQRLNILSELTRSIAYALHRRPDGATRVSWSTPHFGSISGFTPEEVNESGWESIVHPDDRPRAQTMVDRAVAGETVRGPLRYITRDGAIRHVLHYMAPFQHDALGTTLLGAVVDVTEWKAAEQALNASQARFREIADAINDIFWMVSVPDGQLVYINNAWERVWGQPISELCTANSTFLQNIHPDDRPDVIAQFRRFCRFPQSESYDVHYRIVRPDGEIRHIADRGTPVANPDGAIDRVIGVARDITEQWLLQQQLLQSQKMEAFGRMAGGIAHDFNNWLTVIIGTCDSLRNSIHVDDSRRQAVETIEAAGQHAASLTRQLLAVSSRQMLSPRLLDLNATIQQLEPMLRRLLGEDLIVTTQLAPDLDLIHADVSQIEQVIVNLAVNARDAMPKTGELRIDTRNVTIDANEVLDAALPLVPGRYVRLTVSDTGTGMTEKVRRHLFEPFFTTKPTGKGSGLGLATVLGIVRQSRGDISVESTRGVGTTFRLLFPAHPSPTPSTDRAGGDTPTVVQLPPEPAMIAPPDEQPPAVPTTVLLVEDEAAVRKVVSAILKRRGFLVLEAPDGEAAQSLATRHARDIQLVVTDVVMPGLCGRQLADDLRLRIPGVPILFTSGHTDEALINHGIEQNSEAFLQKPFTPQLLLAKVQHLLTRETVPRTLAP